MAALRDVNGRYVGNRPVRLKKSNWKARKLWIGPIGLYKITGIVWYSEIDHGDILVNFGDILVNFGDIGIIGYFGEQKTGGMIQQNGNICIYSQPFDVSSRQ